MIIEHMTLDELLRRKAIDYGYGSVRAMARAMGLTKRGLEPVAQGRYGLSIRLRRLIVSELDVAPEVLERLK